MLFMANQSLLHEISLTSVRLAGRSSGSRARTQLTQRSICSARRDEWKAWQLGMGKKFGRCIVACVPALLVFSGCNISASDRRRRPSTSTCNATEGPWHPGRSFALTALVWYIACRKCPLLRTNVAGRTNATDAQDQVSNHSGLRISRRLTQLRTGLDASGAEVFQGWSVSSYAANKVLDTRSSICAGLFWRWDIANTYCDILTASCANDHKRCAVTRAQLHLSLSTQAFLFGPTPHWWA
jgi:hypothetical protein